MFTLYLLDLACRITLVGYAVVKLICQWKSTASPYQRPFTLYEASITNNAIALDLYGPKLYLCNNQRWSENWKRKQLKNANKLLHLFLRFRVGVQCKYKSHLTKICSNPSCFFFFFSLLHFLLSFSPSRAKFSRLLGCCHLLMAFYRNISAFQGWKECICIWSCVWFVVSW